MKRIRYVDGVLDRLDRDIIEALCRDARLPLRELSAKVGLSPPSTAERIRRLEEAGVIAGYGLKLNVAAAGLPVGAYLRIRPMPGELARVAALIAEIPQVIGCDRVTGEDCFIARVAVASVGDLETLLDRLLPYASTNTAVVVSTTVQERPPPIP